MVDWLAFVHVARLQQGDLRLTGFLQASASVARLNLQRIDSCRLQGGLANYNVLCNEDEEEEEEDKIQMDHEE
ncbi:hypothetical protein PoB_002433900 [Plakobranchus ocellatus]|uniref:Uncharacterized protein n=1 Tax=Plakobranchus ocellatus TaxID=259542 RepID=A0AAV3ZTU3_9GAST|nr:hypothetical protein PoB_002433900 [Plakobranchus ocellatus]